MAQLNKVFLMGNLTADPELRRIANGTAVTDLRMAINRTYQGKDGERQSDVLYVDVTVWDRQAESCCQYLKKGRAVHVEGFLKMDSWDDKTTGEKRTKLKVQADRVQFLDRKDDMGGGGASMGDDEYGAPAARRPMGNGAPRPAYGGSAPSAPRRPSTPPAAIDQDVEDDDIPF